MKTEIHLDANDIKSILAKHYDVPESNITVWSKEATVGYGLNEHTERVVEGIITFPNSDTTIMDGTQDEK